MSNLRHVSATQVTQFQRCQRVWWWGYVQGYKQPTTPAMERGSKIHDALEEWQKTGKIVEDPDGYHRYVEAVRDKGYVGEPKDDESIVEEKVWMNTEQGLPPWLGYIDYGHQPGDLPRLLDYKTTSDFRYNKTPAELSVNVQLLSYARWFYEMNPDYEDDIEVGHVYLKTYPKKIPKKPQTGMVIVQMTKDHVMDVWGSSIITSISEMVEVATVNNVDDIPPNVVACSDYGGCFHRDRCGIRAEDLNSLFKSDKKKKEKENKMANSFLQKVKKGKGKKNGKAEVLPPDAPGRVNEEEEEIEEEEVAAKPTRKKAVAKGEAAKAKAKTKAPPKKKKQTKTPPKPKEVEVVDKSLADFVMYIDCVPTKGDDCEYVLFEDWYEPLIEALNEAANEQDEEVRDYRLMGFAQEKVMLREGIQTRAESDDLPSVLVINSTAPGAKDAIGCLIPFANRVVRAMR